MDNLGFSHRGTSHSNCTTIGIPGLEIETWVPGRSPQKKRQNLMKNCLSEKLAKTTISYYLTMPISFAEIHKGGSYSRNVLAEIWGYSSYHALAKGVFTPADDNKIVLFVTEEKQASAEPYVDKLAGDCLEWDGPKDHLAQDRMLKSTSSSDEIHLFYRSRHHSDFIYQGRLNVIGHVLHANKPSHFTFQLC